MNIYGAIMMFHVAWLFLLLSVVFSEDIYRAFYVLDDMEPGSQFFGSILLDKNMRLCTENEECTWIVKGDQQYSTKWHKNLYALKENIKSLAPVDCRSTRLTGATFSGVYTMFVDRKIEQIPCDMTTDGGGWTIFQRRIDAAVDFNRSWTSYKVGFGDRERSFWLGLDLLHYIVSQGESEIRIDLTTNKRLKFYAKYSNVYIDDEFHGYKLTVSHYSGTVRNALSYNNNMKFSTYDRDNDHFFRNCADMRHGGFWYKRCSLAHPNSLYPSNNETSLGYIRWYGIQKADGAIVSVEMKIRRKVGWP